MGNSNRIIHNSSSTNSLRRAKSNQGQNASVQLQVEQYYEDDRDIKAKSNQNQKPMLYKSNSNLDKQLAKPLVEHDMHSQLKIDKPNQQYSNNIDITRNPDKFDYNFDLYQPINVASEAHALQNQIRQRDLKIEQLLKDVHLQQKQINEKQKDIDANSATVRTLENQLIEKDQ